MGSVPLLNQNKHVQKPSLFSCNHFLPLIRDSVINDFQEKTNWKTVKTPANEREGSANTIILEIHLGNFNSSLCIPARPPHKRNETVSRLESHSTHPAPNLWYSCSYEHKILDTACRMISHSFRELCSRHYRYTLFNSYLMELYYDLTHATYF